MLTFAARAWLALSALSLVATAGCHSFDWNNRIKATPENWKAIQTASTTLHFKVTYVRENEMATRRSENEKAVGALYGVAGDRVVAKRRGEWIYFRVERWNRVGIGLGQGWDLRALVPESENDLCKCMADYQGVTLAPWAEVHSDKNLLEEGTVEVPSDAPEYAETENRIFR